MWQPDLSVFGGRLESFRARIHDGPFQRSRRELNYEMAVRLGISETVLGRLLRSDANPKLRTLATICRSLIPHHPPDKILWLITGDIAQEQKENTASG